MHREGLGRVAESLGAEAEPRTGEWWRWFGSLFVLVAGLVSVLTMAVSVCRCSLCWCCGVDVVGAFAVFLRERGDEKGFGRIQYHRMLTISSRTVPSFVPATSTMSRQSTDSLRSNNRGKRSRWRIYNLPLLPPLVVRVGT